MGATARQEGALPEPPEDGGSLTTDDLAEAAAGMAIARARLNAMRAFLNQFDYEGKDPSVVFAPDVLLLPNR